MTYITEKIAQVVEAMRPIGTVVANKIVSKDYGQGMADYLTETNAKHANLPDMPYYMYGHRLEISNRLLEKDEDKVFKYQKYPLVALRMDIPESMNDGLIEVNLNIAFLCFTEKERNAEERMLETFYPVLIPMYDRFMEELRESGLFMWDEFQDNPPHERFLRPFWGVEESEGNSKYIFNDPLDCIEVKNLKVKFEKEYC